MAAGVARILFHRRTRPANQQAATHDATPVTDLSKLEALTLAQAQSLSLSESPELLLRNLRDLTPDVAYALAQHRGTLYLEGVITVSEEAARALRLERLQRIPVY